MNNIQKLKETILKEYPRLKVTDRFRFECGPHLACFNKCCADVNIFLTPYDVLRMRKALKMGSAEFLGRYTIVPFDKNQLFPVPLLLMDEDAGKICPFVDPERGCTIYPDRPWPCRMYPLGMASPSETAATGSETFYFILKEDVCDGFGSDREWTISEWLEDQGITPYDEFGRLFKEVTLHPKTGSGWKPNEKQVEMYWMALYDIDRFRSFIFDSTFLERFDVPPEEAVGLKEDDEALLKFGFRWVRMALFGERTVPIKPEEERRILETTKST